MLQRVGSRLGIVLEILQRRQKHKEYSWLEEDPFYLSSNAFSPFSIGLSAKKGTTEEQRGRKDDENMHGGGGGGVPKGKSERVERCEKRKEDEEEGEEDTIYLN